MTKQRAPYPTYEELIARQPRYPYNAGQTGTISNLAFHLRSSEDRAWGHDPCAHERHEQSCPRCRFSLAAVDYSFAAEIEIYRRFGGGGERPHDPETIKQLEANAAEAQADYDRVVAAREKHRRIDLIDAAIESDFADTLLARAKFAARMAEQAAARKLRRIERENGVVRVQHRRSPRVRSL